MAGIPFARERGVWALRFHDYLCGGVAAGRKENAQCRPITPWEPTDSNSSSSPLRIPKRWAMSLKDWVFGWSGGHRSKNVTQYRQGDINFIVNAEPKSPGRKFRVAARAERLRHGFSGEGRRAAYERALAKGARPFPGAPGPMELNIPAIEGIGGSALYLVDRYGGHTIYDVDFLPVGDEQVPGTGLARIDHLTHNVFRGRMDHWAKFYEDLFNFREIRYFDIEGKLTGLKSRAMTSPDGKIRIPLNESVDDKESDRGISGEVQRRRHSASCAVHGRYLCHGRGAEGNAACRSPSRRRMRITKCWTSACRDTARRLERMRSLGHSRSTASRPGRAAAADFHHNADRPDLLRDHPAQGRRGIWRRQFQGAVRIHGARPDPARRAGGSGQSAARRGPAVAASKKRSFFGGIYRHPRISTKIRGSGCRHAPSPGRTPPKIAARF